jgi:hypothetical protein
MLRLGTELRRDIEIHPTARIATACASTTGRAW